MTEPDSGNPFSDDEPDVGGTPLANNPYQAPVIDDEPVVAEVAKRDLHVGDWLLAIILGIVSFFFVFPSTCLGMLVVFQGPGAGSHFDRMVWASGIVALAIAVFVGWIYLRARR